MYIVIWHDQHEGHEAVVPSRATACRLYRMLEKSKENGTVFAVHIYHGPMEINPETWEPFERGELLENAVKRMGYVKAEPT